MNEFDPTRRLKKPNRWLLVVYNNVNEAAATLIGMFCGVPPKIRTFLSAESLISVLLLGVAVCVFLVVQWSVKHASCFASREASWTIPTTAARTCPPLPYESVLEHNISGLSPGRVCLTSLTDVSLSNKGSLSHNAIRCRDFDSVGRVVGENHDQYAARHGYKYTLSDAVDISRPPAWSKIKAVQSRLDSGECDWVMWLDADVVFMNSTIRVESLIDARADLITTPDRSFGVSSGVWLIRNSAWSHQFLQDWWNMHRYVRSKGLSLSGDNKAFGVLVHDHLEKVEGSSENIRVTPGRCAMNSNGLFLNEDGIDAGTRRSDWKGSTDFYHSGDFIAHAAGVNDKLLAIQQLIDVDTSGGR